jgi:hypothetical protein
VDWLGLDAEVEAVSGFDREVLAGSGAPSGIAQCAELGG